MKEFTLCMWSRFYNHTNDHPLFSYAGERSRFFFLSPFLFPFAFFPFAPRADEKAKVPRTVLFERARAFDRRPLLSRSVSALSPPRGGTAIAPAKCPERVSQATSRRTFSPNRWQIFRAITQFHVQLSSSYFLEPFIDRRDLRKLADYVFVSSGGSTARDIILGGEHRQEFLLHDERERAQLVQIELSAPIEQVVPLLPKLERPHRRMADLGQRRARGSRVQQQGEFGLLGTFNISVCWKTARVERFLDKHCHRPR